MHCAADLRPRNPHPKTIGISVCNSFQFVLAKDIPYVKRLSLYCLMCCFPENISWTCPSHFPDLSRKCPGTFPELFRKCPVILEKVRGNRTIRNKNNKNGEKKQEHMKTNIRQVGQGTWMNRTNHPDHPIAEEN